VALSVGIRGAGVAGLSLARSLKQHMPECGVTLFDTRPRLPHPQRTFCFFLDPHMPPPMTPDVSWSRVTFTGPSFTRSIACAHSPYSLIHGERFFGLMLSELEEKGVLFRWSCPEISVAKRHISCNGETREFDVVVDAAFEASAAAPILWQSFAGLWVSADFDLFHRQEALLMELGPSSNEAPVSFMYVLPTSARAGLIEHTAFSRAPMSQEAHLSACKEWMEKRKIDGARIERIEHAAIPMGLPALSGEQGVPCIGTRGGALRASTGYAFQAIQSQVEDLAQQIVQSSRIGGVLPRQREPFPAWMSLSDRLFLRTLARVPTHGSFMLERLLHRAPERELLSFLAGNASFGDALKVMMCMPKREMLGTLCWG